MVVQTASIPESIICYKAGTEDPDNPENRIVTEYACPKHGTIYSPGGGVCITMDFVGGPKDGKKEIIGDTRLVFETEDGEEHLYEGDFTSHKMNYKDRIDIPIR